ncbi:hypothetical protein ATZ36_17020 [Candidatus Endomicrobiellum trichonymphae]|jgi:hypothetical protein|uniref:Uncharacterized protein n=1 Tax=Endomicrobium trichonymphae TaxID=1408204 RepID=A0A1E5IL49_ENDTX|nr:hypothetical protein ATZ36_17020 [Candidatus Endomicrobium trichonymphae]
MVDFLSLIMFKKYEYGEEFFYNIIKKLVVDETVLFRYEIKREKNLKNILGLNLEELSEPRF